MMKTKNVVAALRRDVTFVGNAVIAVVFICFASLALAAALHRSHFDPALARIVIGADLSRNRFPFSGSRARRISMPLPVVVLDHDMLAAVRSGAREIVRPDRRFAVAARNIEHIGRLA